MRKGAGWLAAGLLGWFLAALPPVREMLEASLALHVLVQLPLLAAAGWGLGRVVGPVRPGELAGFNGAGVPGLLLAAFTTAFWLLPRSLDAALQEPAWEAAKLTTVPLLLGLPLARSWPRLPPLGRALIRANLVPMLAVMGWLYHVAPDRLCNSYLLDQQARLGNGLLAVAAALAVAWTVMALRGGEEPR